MNRFFSMFGENKDIKTIKHRGKEIKITSMDEEDVTDEFVSIGLRFNVENGYDFFSWSGRSGTHPKKDWLTMGLIEATFDYYTLEEIKEMDCSEDMLSLLESWEGKPFWTKNKIPTLEINLSKLDSEYHNQRIGYLMYQETALIALKVYKMPMLFTANYCIFGKTSDKARRLWGSLRRRNKDNSSGDVLLIAPNKSKYSVK